MDTSISDIAEHAMEALRAIGYMESTVSQYRKVFQYLAVRVEDGMRTAHDGDFHPLTT